MSTDSFDVSALLFTKSKSVAIPTTNSTNAVNKGDALLTDTSLINSMLGSDTESDDDNNKAKKNKKKKVNKHKKAVTEKSLMVLKDKKQQDPELVQLQQQRKLAILKQKIQNDLEAMTKAQATASADPNSTKELMEQKIHERNREKQLQQTSKNVRRLLKRSEKKVSLESLRSITNAFDLVADEDTTAPDPFFLVYLKTFPYCIKVSNHWAQKRRLYANQSGNQKTTFVLPTCIEDLNARHLVQTTAKSLVQEISERAKAKVGRHNIDYEQWHDAFYVNMPDPNYLKMEDVFYENKYEKEQFNHLTPYDPISPALQRALGMMGPSNPTPASTVSIMPPWIPQMQQHGPPPAYPNLYIPGVNAPLPPGASWGPVQTIGNQSSSTWGMQPTIQLVDSSTGQPQIVPKWEGDLFGESPYMKELQKQLTSIYMGEIFDQSTASAGINTNNTGNDNETQYKSLTGVWLPRPKIAPPVTTKVVDGKIQTSLDSSILIPKWTPVVQQPLLHKLYKHQDVSSQLYNRVTVQLFGAIDYMQHELSIHQQLQSQRDSTPSPHTTVEDDSYRVNQGTGAPTSVLAPAHKNGQSAEEIAKWKEEQRQKLIESSISSNLQFLVGGAAPQQASQSDPAFSIPAGELYCEIQQTNQNSTLDHNINVMKRKQAPQDDDDDDDEIHLNKKQRI